MYVLAFGEKKQNIFRGGVTHLGPLEKIWPVRKKKSNKFFALDPQFLFDNIKVLYKIGCLQKTRVHKIENLPSYGHLKIIFFFVVVLNWPTQQKLE